MEKGLVAVLGGGNGGHAVAANLSLAGFKVIKESIIEKTLS